MQLHAFYRATRTSKPITARATSLRNTALGDQRSLALRLFYADPPLSESGWSEHEGGWSTCCGPCAQIDVHPEKCCCPQETGRLCGNGASVAMPVCRWFSTALVNGVIVSLNLPEVECTIGTVTGSRGSLLLSTRCWLLSCLRCLANSSCHNPRCAIWECLSVVSRPSHHAGCSRAGVLSLQPIRSA